jgi:SH3-like domain-containing protein
LLGHAMDGNAHKPCIKAFSLLIDRSVDQTEKFVPKINTAMLASDGTIKFAENRKDIILPLVASASSRHQKGNKRKIATTTKSDVILVWSNGKYSFTSTNGVTEAAPQVAAEVKPADVTPSVPETSTTKIAAQTPVVQPVVVPPVTKTVSKETAEPTVPMSTKTSTDKSSTKATAHSTPTVNELGTGNVGAEYANVKMRSGPGTGNAIVSQIEKGTAVQIIGTTDCWYKIRANGQEGYVYAGLIDYDKKDAYKTGTLTKNAKIFDDRHRLLETASPGDRLVILQGTRHSKYKVQLANGSIGYLDKEAIDGVTSAPTPVASAPPSSSRTSSVAVESQPPLVP